MKALTIWQPWASLIAAGTKTVETRSWTTSHRGQIAIHAAARQPVADAFSERQRIYLARKFGRDWRSALPLGAVIAIVHLADCLPIEQIAANSWGDYGPGRYGWLLENVRRLARPIPAIGQQGLWEWDESETNRSARLA